MKDKLNRFMQGRYGVDNFARLTLGVALFVIVVGSFMRQNARECKEIATVRRVSAQSQFTAPSSPGFCAAGAR